MSGMLVDTDVAPPPDQQTAQHVDQAPIRIAATTTGDLLLAAADGYPDSQAVIFPGRQATYSELQAAAMRRARSLMGLGIGKGDHVGLLLPTHQDFVEMFFAVGLCGAVAVLLNARYKSTELAFVTENADLKTIITCAAVDEHVNFVQRLVDTFAELPGQPNPFNLQLDQAPTLRSIVVLGDQAAPGCLDEATFDSLSERIDEAAVHRVRLTVRLADTAIIMYTSGTSASPKGCLITHEAIVRGAMNLGRNRWRFKPDERVWSPLPLFHIAALLPLLSSVDCGGAFIGVPHFKARESVEQIQRERVTMVFAPFVTFLQQMALEPGFKTADFSTIRVMNSCFAVQPKSVSDAYRVAMPDSIQVGTYGMTELAGIGSTGGYEMDRELGYTGLGWPLDGMECRIVDRETGEEVPPGAPGEMLWRGYSVFSGYYKDPVRTAEALDRDGWLHSGDIGSIDAHGTVMFLGRTKDMLKVGGENVAAAEVESLLTLHPAVKLAQVCGIPDDMYVEVPVAFVELNTATEASAGELIEFCKSRISGFKVPRHVRFVDSWPMSASKIQKFKLRQSLMSELGLE